jgi:hypothetical protein
VGEEGAEVTIVAFAPAYDSPGKRDATGAFLPEAKAFARLHDCDRVIIDNRHVDAHMRQHVRDAIEARDEIRCLAFFCHGFRSGIQFGFRLYSSAMIVDSLAPRMARDCVIALYCCDTGRDGDAEREDDLDPGPGGEGGFADALRDALRAKRRDWTGWVDGHVTAAHTTRNPHVRRMHAHGDSSYLIPRDGETWDRWRVALRETDLRLRFPLMTRGQIEDELRGSP